MQEEIAAGRTTGECKSDCNSKGRDNPNFNKARCRQNCDQIRDAGNNRNNDGRPCSDCDESFPDGGRRWERCKASCIPGAVR